MINKDSVIKEPVFHGDNVMSGVFFFVSLIWGSLLSWLFLCARRGCNCMSTWWNKVLQVRGVFFLGENLGSYTPGYTNMAGWKMGAPGLKMYVFPIEHGGYSSHRYVSLLERVCFFFVKIHFKTGKNPWRMVVQNVGKNV